MSTAVSIDGTGFQINGVPTYEGRVYKGRSVEGLLLNSRMIQAIFDDENPQTAERWRYPDTGEWDPDRNTDEFCAALPEYRRHGLLGVTVGLQGGGSIYTPDVYDQYECSAYEPDGTFRPPYFDRLKRVLAAADECGMVVIVNYFYWKHALRLESEKTMKRISEEVTGWLLETGHQNILVDVFNEASKHWKMESFAEENLHRWIELVQGTALNGRRLLVGISTLGGQALPTGRWAELEDISMPHGNGLQPEQLGEKLKRFKDGEAYQKRPRPILVNEDSVFVENLEAAVAEGASWGFYCQGYGSVYQDRMNWKTHAREDRYEDLSGYQTLPVNWGINTPIKKAFFDRVLEITGGE
jgi:hypothetical protein